jgi:hypothetical protein
MLIWKDFCHSVNMHGTYTNRYRFPQVFLSLRSRTDHRRGCGMHPEARRRSDFSSLRRRTLMTNDWQRAFHQSTRVCDSIYVCFHHMSICESDLIYVARVWHMHVCLCCIAPIYACTMLGRYVAHVIFIYLIVLISRA